MTDSDSSDSAGSKRTTDSSYDRRRRYSGSDYKTKPTNRKAASHRLPREERYSESSNWSNDAVGEMPQNSEPETAQQGYHSDYDNDRRQAPTSRRRQTPKAHPAHDFQGPPSIHINNAQGPIHIGHNFTTHNIVYHGYTISGNGGRHGSTPVTHSVPPQVKRVASCKNRVTETDIRLVSETIGKGWKTLGEYLGFSAERMEYFERECKPDSSKAIYEMLLEWTYINTCIATVGRLCFYLWKSKERKSSVELANRHVD